MTISDAVRADAHLSPDEVASLRSLLMGQLVEHAEQDADCRATIDELTGQVDSDSVLERELAETSSVHHAAAVQDVQDALSRMTAGVYGQCEVCAASLPFERLEVIPQARRCVACSVSPGGLIP